MPTTFLKGDLFAAAAARTGVRALAFAADCAGTMDDGVAVAFRKRWPALAEAYRAHCAGNKMQPGDVFTWRDGELVVYALGLRRGGGKPKISTLVRAARAMISRASSDGASAIVLPRVGAGKNGLEWARVKAVLTELGAETPVEILVFEQFVRTPEAPPPG
jgi:O-acetyl-ADP-ribose deacetylase (regulator of RNase III)